MPDLQSELSKVLSQTNFDSIVNQLNVLQAKALLVRLKQVFGEIQ